jgi:hypothetical protein
MKICDSHWQQLRQAIDERGLMGFVAKDGDHAAQNMVAQLQGTDTKENFDPLMSATFAIWGNSIEMWGLEIVQPDAPCPLCLLDDHAATCTEASCARNTGTDWIKFAADGQVEAATRLGLLSKPN